MIALFFELICDFFEEQGMCGHGGACGATVFFLDDGAETFKRHFSLPHFEQCTDDGAHHISQKTVGFDMEDEQVVLFKPVGFHNFAVVCLDLCVQL